MSDLVTIERSELVELIRTVSAKAVMDTLEAVGIKYRTIKPWITQNQASKLVGRKRLETAMKNGLVEWRKTNPGTKTGRVYILHKDVQKLLNNPLK